MAAVSTGSAARARLHVDVSRPSTGAEAVGSNLREVGAEQAHGRKPHLHDLTLSQEEDSAPSQEPLQLHECVDTGAGAANHRERAAPIGFKERAEGLWHCAVEVVPRRPAQGHSIARLCERGLRGGELVRILATKSDARGAVP